MDKEIRLAKIEIEERADSSPKFRGYAAVFDAKTDIGGMFIEQISRGAFKDALNRSDIHAVYNHDSNWVLGRNKSGTLTLQEDDKGLYIEIDPPNTQQARDIAELVRRGDVDQMSFAFTMEGGKETWDDSASGLPIRTIERVGELYDVTITPRGAYSQTSVSLRGLDEIKQQRSKNFEAAQKRIRQKRIDLLERLSKENGKAIPPSLIDNSKP